MSIESIVNQALDLIGYKRHLGNLWDGSPAARMALNVWGDTRDTLFMVTRPDFSIWDDALVPAKTAPPWYDDIRLWSYETDPDMPWRYEYELPELCLVPLTIKPRPHYLPVWRPLPMRFRIKGSFDSKYILLGDDPAPVLTCVHSVHDTDLWHNDFTEAMARALAKKMQHLMPGAAKESEGKADANNAR